MVWLAGCATTDPGAAAGIDYRLPRTDAAVTLSLDITACSPLALDAALKIDGVAGAQDDYLHIPGSALSSAITKRSLTVSVTDNHVISSINGGATDKRAQILADVVKIAATILPVALAVPVPAPPRGVAPPAPPPPPPPQPDCNAESQSNLAAVGLLTDLIAKRRKDASTATSGTSDIQQDIDAAGTLLAAAKTALHLDVSVNLKPEDFQAETDYRVVFDDDAIKALKKKLQPIDARTLTWLELTASLKEVAIAQDVPTKAPTNLDSCDRFIPIPYAKPFSMTVKPKGGPIDQGKQAVETLYVSQKIRDRPGTRPYCVTAGFGESRTVGLTLDKFGRVTTFSWDSDATAANVSSALAGASADTATLIGLDPKALRTKAELDKLTNENDLIKARQCRVKLDTGGKCD